MSYIEAGQLGASQEMLLRVFSLNTCQTGREYGLFQNILDFLSRERPAVVLLQEVFEGSLERIGNALGGQIVFSPLCRLSLSGRQEDAEGWGIAIGSRLPILESRDQYYKGSRDSVEVNLDNSPASCRSLLQAQIKVGSDRFNFATTHFTWHNRPEPSEEQLRDFAALSLLLGDNSDMVLTGDFNSPRGYPIFDSLAKRFKDNIPPSITTTFDTSIRPEATWEYVEDGFFTKLHNPALNVGLVEGLSDHRGIRAEVR